MNNLSALVVDDSKSARLFLKNLLEDQQIHVYLAASGAQALAWLEAHRPDAIFLDHVMVDMDGLEVLEQLKADSVTSEIPVVMCTSNNEEAFIRQVEGIGAVAVLSKPPTPSLLGQVLTKLHSIKAESEKRELEAAAAEEPEVPPAAPVELPETAVSEPQVPGLTMDEVTAAIEERLMQWRSGVEEGLTETVQGQLREKLVALERVLENQLNQEVKKIQQEVGNLKAEKDVLRRSFEGQVKQLVQEEMGTTFFATEAYIKSKAEELAQPPLDKWRQQFFSDPRLKEDMKVAATEAAREATELQWKQSLATLKELDVEALVESRVADSSMAVETVLRDEIAAAVRSVNRQTMSKMVSVGVAAAVVGAAAGAVAGLLF